MALSKALAPGASTISQRLARRGFPVMAHYLAAVLTWPAYADKEAIEKEVARIEAVFPFAPEYADFAARTQEDVRAMRRGTLTRRLVRRQERRLIFKLLRKVGL